MASAQRSGDASFVARATTSPLLDQYVETNLVVEYQAGNALAGHRLAESHLRLVLSIANEYRGYVARTQANNLPGITMQDLVSAGSVGLMTAVKKFKLDKGVRLSSYAAWFIRGHIQELVLENYSMVKVASTKPQRKLFFHMKREKRRLGIDPGVSMSPEQTRVVAQNIGDVRPEDVTEMETRLNVRDESLNMSSTAEGDERLNLVADDRANHEEILAEENELTYRRRLMGEAFKLLDPRERDILERRRLCQEEERQTLDQISREYGISVERVRQIEASAVKKLQATVKALDAPSSTMIAACEQRA